MAMIIQKLYQEYQESIPYADPRTRDWPLLWRSPIYVWALTALYLLIVWLGPKYMKKRPAYSLQTFMVLYNLSLVALSVYMFVEILLSTSEAKYEWMCARYNAETRNKPEELRVAKVMWWYFFSKAIEFMDTVLMVLRKRNHQITFLHVFHHATMLNIWWWVCMFIPGGLSYFGSGLNCLVHVVMYSYYGLSAIPSLKGKLWWKNYITRFQLVQFCVTLTHSLYALYSGCDFPLWGKNILVYYMVIMLVLFTNFYIRSYILKNRHRAEKRDSQTNGMLMNNGNMKERGDGYNRSISNGKKKAL